MPNWCLNSLDITGLDQDLDALLTQAAPPAGPDGDIPCGEEPFSLESLLPTPHGLSRSNLSQKSDLRPNNDLRNAAEDEWRSLHWGTAAELHEVMLTREPAHLLVAFLSAFTPPLVALKTLSARFPRLRFALAYEENNVFFRGTLIMENGHSLEETFEDYHEQELEEDGEEA